MQLKRNSKRWSLYQLQILDLIVHTLPSLCRVGRREFVSAPSSTYIWVCERISTTNRYSRESEKSPGIPEYKKLQKVFKNTICSGNVSRNIVITPGFKMFYTPDILCMRRKGRLARVWLAATLNERLFKQAVSNKALLAIDIDATCNEILLIVMTGGQFRSRRFSLYLSSQLMYGMCKLLNYQTIMFEASLFRVHRELTPAIMPPKKKTKTLSDSDFTIDLPQVPPLKKTFKNLQLRADIHLLPEADYEPSEALRARTHVESPTFGELTDEEVHFFLTEDDWQLQTLGGFDTTELNEPIRYGENNPNQRPVSSPPPIEQQDLGMTDGLGNSEDTVAVENLGSVLKTPKKRESRINNDDTPTKRRRRNLHLEVNETEERLSPPPIPDDGSVPLPGNDLTEVAIDSAIQQTNRSGDATAPDDNELHLDTLEFDAVIPPRKRRHRIIFIDEHTTLRQEELARLIANPLAHTIPKALSTVKSLREQSVPASLLLAIPATCHCTISRNWLQNGPRHSKWALKLRAAFELRTVGPFTAEDDLSMSAEAIRAAESRAQDIPEEISSGLARRLAEESCRNKTDEDPRLLESIHPQTISALPLEGDHLLETNVDHIEPTLDNTGEEENAVFPVIPEFDVAPVDAANNNNVQDANVGGKGSVIGTKVSDPDTEDLDAFLPPELRIRDVLKKTSHEKRSAPEAIVEIPDSPFSMRSEGSVFQSDWTYPELQALLAVRWEECGDTRALKLSDLVPPESTSALDAATCFTLLLELHKNKIVKLAQAEPFSDIYIYEAVGARSP